MMSVSSPGEQGLLQLNQTMQGQMKFKTDYAEFKQLLVSHNQKLVHDRYVQRPMQLRGHLTNLRRYHLSSVVITSV